MINTGLIAINDAQRCRQIKHENVDYFPQFLVGCYALSYLGMYSACTLNWTSRSPGICNPENEDSICFSTW